MENEKERKKQKLNPHKYLSNTKNVNVKILLLYATSITVQNATQVTSPITGPLSVKKVLKGYIETRRRSGGGMGRGAPPQPTRGSGRRRKLPSGVQGGATTSSAFGAVLSVKERFR